MIRLRPLTLSLGLLLSGAALAQDPALTSSEPATAPETPVATDAPPMATPKTDAAAQPAPVELAQALVPDDLRVGAVLARLSARLDPSDCDAGPDALAWQKKYAHNPRAFADHVTQIMPLLEFVLSEIERQDLPGEFALIPIIESWYQPNAIGIGGPAGMWQMIASTARNHGVTIRNGYDGRLSPVESTRAALSYLETLHGMFGEWQATVMAYNAGEYRLINSFRRDGNREVSAAKRLPRGLSPITYNYVHKLQALSCLLGGRGRETVPFPVHSQIDRLAPILVGEDIDSMKRLATGSGLDDDRLRRLNPGHKHGRFVAGAPRLILMPASMQAAILPMPQGSDMAQLAADAAPSDPTPEPAVDERRMHRVGSGETLWSIAKRYGLSIDVLRQINRLGRRSVLRPGQQLFVSP
ncbi:transglycosylase SLT domain-containing protein [Arenimonas sp.]|uniref:transglycosylase SLT domain-containing protein n=1 Tax=Arenimonas sp. TaxID=1872635 RepID=UPI0039E70084